MDVMRQMAGAGAVLAGFAAVLWILRRGGILRLRGWAKLASNRRPRSLETIERLPLTAQHTLHLVRLGERALLLAATPTGCTLVQTLDCHEISSAGMGERS
jgi:flagellar biogenesis protein FliO